MAKKGYSRMTKVQPAVQTMTFVITSKDAGKETNYIDLSQCASILNRRFYRQGINWAVSSFKVLSGAGTTGSVSIRKMPNTWIVSNSWEKAFRAWKRQQDEVMEDGTQESSVARFNDFKIHLNEDHFVKGVGKNLLPTSASTLASIGITVATPGEWDMSQIVVPNYGAPGTNWEPYLQMVGDNGAPSTAPPSIGLIAAYENSRAVPQSPDPAIPPGIVSLDNVYRSMFDVGDNNDDIADNATLKNNDLPYPQDDYPAGSVQLPSLEIHDQEFITGTTVGGTTRLKGGSFPCGLIEIGTLGIVADATLIVQVNLVPGTHRGYLCEPMTDM
jgi:hypothetical protein